MENKFRFRIAALETAAIFLLCLLYGFWPVPDVNEPYYVGKAIHFWNHDYFANDPFLNAPDSHWLFFAFFGFFSLFLKPASLVWFGRILIWFLTAFGWQRLSSALIPKKGWSVLTAAAFLFYLENFHLAGEWVVGGVEGKGFAFPFLFWGLGMYLRRSYGRAYILMGIASAFHVLVGGWGVLASLGGLLYSECREHRLSSGKQSLQYSFKPLIGGLALGGIIALAGILPALELDRGAAPGIRYQAHFIYVYERLAHHLVPSTLPWIFRTRFLLLSLIWIFFCRWTPKEQFEKKEENPRAETSIWRRWNAFTAFSLLFAGIGLFLDYGVPCFAKIGWLANDHLAADFLRFYWFRLSDWAIPAGIAFGSAACLSEILAQKQNIFAERGKYISTFLLGIFLFVTAKKLFLAHSLAVAQKATVSPFFPVPPRPVDALAFMTVLLIFGLVFQINRRVRKGQSASAAVISTVLSVSLLLLAPIWGGVSMLEMKTGVLVPRSNPPKESISNGWIEICRWAEANTPEDAVFLVPRGYESWKWNAHRPEVGNWKEMPQDAASIVVWYEMMEDLFTTGTKKGKDRWNDPLIAVMIAKGEKRILNQSEKYGIDYIVAEQPPYNLAANPKAKERFDELTAKYKVYQNSHFIVFRLTHPESSE